MNNGFQQMWAEIKVSGTMHWKSTENIKTLKTLIQHDNIFWNCFFLFSLSNANKKLQNQFAEWTKWWRKCGGLNLLDWQVHIKQSILSKLKTGLGRLRGWQDVSISAITKSIFPLCLWVWWPDSLKLLIFTLIESTSHQHMLKDAILLF